MTTAAPSEAIRFPFAVPPAFTRDVGYDTYAPHFWGVPFQVTFTPRRLVGFWWTAGADELTWDDGLHALCGAEYAPFLDLTRRGVVLMWVTAQSPEVDLGSSDSEATHWLVIDRETGEAYVAPVKLARAMVVQQRLAPE